MAYEGGFPPQQRPYAGPAAQRPSPGPGPGPGPGPYQQPPSRQYDTTQQYGEYQDDYGYGYYDDAENYGKQYQDSSYGTGPSNPRLPPQDYYGPDPNGPPGPGRGGRPMPPPGPRGGQPYPPRGGGPGRGYGGPPGRGGRPVQYERSGSSDPASNRAPRSPVEGGPYSAYPGPQRRPDFGDEAQMIDQMAGMDINQRANMPMGRGAGSQRRGMRPPDGDYGRPPMDGSRGPPRNPPQGYADPRRGPGPDPGYGAPGPNDYAQQYPDDGYGIRGPPARDFGPPSRSMTLPVNDPMQRRNAGPPPRMDSMPYNGPPGRGVPPRPATSQSSRLPPQRIYPSNQGPPRGQFGGPEYENTPPSQNYGDLYDYYGPSRMSNPEFGSGPLPGPSDMPNFDSTPRHRQRGSLDLHMQSGFSQEPQPGANRVPDLNRTKSQPDLRQPQTAVFEMAGDIPPLPHNNGPQQGYPSESYGEPVGYDEPRRGSAAGLPSNPAMARPGGGMQKGSSPPQSANPDALPSHPTPVRPGLMADSMVSIGNKPPPVRTYDSSPSGNMNPLPSSQGNMTQPRVQSTPVTPDELERLRMTIKADPNDQDSALRLSKRLLEASDVLVPNVADPKTRARAKERYLMDAHKILKKLANVQNMEAMFILADSLGRGLFGSEPDNKEAFTLYQSAAKAGHAAAAYRTAVCCEIGHEEGGGTRKDPLKAIQWYKRAATLGDTPAMYKMGMIMLKGLLGQPKNPREAVGWLKRAAERADAENPHALHELGLLYESAAPNDVIVRDEVYAFSLFKQAAELGYKFSQFRLGCAYEYGLMGCPIDPRLSIMWYSKAAQQEEHQSELALSGWYLTGSDTVLGQSDTEAYLWARKAAMAGLAKAEYAMGYFTEVGIGVPANIDDAKRWYWRAAAQDFPKARDRLEDLKRAGKNGPRQRERISRSKIGKQQEGECSVM